MVRVDHVCRPARSLEIGFGPLFAPSGVASDAIIADDRYDCRGLDRRGTRPEAGRIAGDDDDRCSVYQRGTFVFYD